jgi:hypothetical protein
MTTIAVPSATRRLSSVAAKRSRGLLVSLSLLGLGRGCVVRDSQWLEVLERWRARHLAARTDGHCHLRRDQ